MRINNSSAPFFALPLGEVPYGDHSGWQGKWLNFDEECVFFRLRFRLPTPARLRIHVSFNEGGEIFWDGKMIERGPFRSDPKHHRFFSHELSLSAGEHTLMARAWALKERAPWGVMDAGLPGFVLAAEAEFETVLSTGIAPWEYASAKGITFELKADDPHLTATGAINIFDLSQYGHCDWQKAERTSPVFTTERALHYSKALYLEASDLPQLIDEPLDVSQMKVVLTGAGEIARIPFQDFSFSAEICDAHPRFSQWKDMIVPPHSDCFLLIDFHDYHAFYYELCAKGEGGCVSAEFVETLYQDSTGKKSECGKYLDQHWRQPHGDIFHTSGEFQSGTPIYWRCGRFLLLRLKAGETPLELRSIHFRRTGYPLDFKSVFSATPDRFSEMEQLMKRTLSLCTHDCLMDCPYYEQLMYIGDARIESLMILAACGDARMTWNAVKLFDASRDFRGLTASSYPVRGRQTIPPYSLIHIAMLHDAVMWTAEGPNLCQQHLTGVRSTLDFYERYRDSVTGLLTSPPGWNYIDATCTWHHGVAPGGTQGAISSVNNLLYLYVLNLAIELEEYFGDDFCAQRWRTLWTKTAASVKKHFHAKELHLYADTFEHDVFSEHAQIFAILSGLDQENALFETTQKLEQASYYFSHYYFECCRMLRRADRFQERFQDMCQNVSKLGLHTTPEHPGDTRSDCHGWSSSALFHFYATLAGIRPVAPGAKKLEIAPLLGDLKEIQGKMIHPQGYINFHFRQEHQGEITGELQLPPGVSGTLLLNHKKIRMPLS